ncbi:MAG: hypothetical protein H0V94_08775 [Actinobacteria bacterium]|nr:hypothetical protein [Actinomycetota bacterium]
MRGGAYAFTGTRDLSGLLVVRYGDESLEGSVIHTYEPRIDRAGVAIRTFRTYRLFRYGPHLLHYEARTGRVSALTDRPAAERALGASGDRLRDDCREEFAWARPPLLP